tara:strand:- start:63 stop:275 length:213 start_codon:yes stop_codon:yes gene_type:complete
MFNFDLAYHFAPLNDDRDHVSIDYDATELPVDLAIQGYHAVATHTDGSQVALKLHNDRTVSTPINQGNNQ